MVDRDEIARSLALARRALHAPPAMKARVRSKLGSSGSSAPSSAGSTGAAPSEGTSRGWGRRLFTRPPPIATVTLLVGLSFGAGYWLGSSRSTAQLGASAASERATPSAPSFSNDLTARSDIASSTRETPAPPAASRDLGAGSGASADATSEVDADATPRSSVRRTSGKTARHMPAGPSDVTDSTWRASKEHTDDAFSEEVALLERTERAIRAGEATLALAFLAELDQKFPSAAMPEERAAALVLARCVQTQTGDGGPNAQREARAGAERFLVGSPASVYSERIRSACQLGTGDTNADVSSEEAARGGH